MDQELSLQSWSSLSSLENVSLQVRKTEMIYKVLSQIRGMEKNILFLRQQKEQLVTQLILKRMGNNTCKKISKQQESKGRHLSKLKQSLQRQIKHLRVKIKQLKN